MHNFIPFKAARWVHGRLEWFERVNWRTKERETLHKRVQHERQTHTGTRTQFQHEIKSFFHQAQHPQIIINLDKCNGGFGVLQFWRNTVFYFKLWEKFVNIFLRQSKCVVMPGWVPLLLQHHPYMGIRGKYDGGNLVGNESLNWCKYMDFLLFRR